MTLFSKLQPWYKSIMQKYASRISISQLVFKSIFFHILDIFYVISIQLYWSFIHKNLPSIIYLNSPFLKRIYTIILSIIRIGNIIILFAVFRIACPCSRFMGLDRKRYFQQLGKSGQHIFRPSFCSDMYWGSNFLDRIYWMCRSSKREYMSAGNGKRKSFVY